MLNMSLMLPLHQSVTDLWNIQFYDGPRSMSLERSRTKIADGGVCWLAQWQGSLCAIRYVQRKGQPKTVKYVKVLDGTLQFDTTALSTGCFQIALTSKLFDEFNPTAKEKKDGLILDGISWDFNNLLVRTSNRVQSKQVTNRLATTSRAFFPSHQSCFRAVFLAVGLGVIGFPSFCKSSRRTLPHHVCNSIWQTINDGSPDVRDLLTAHMSSRERRSDRKHSRLSRPSSPHPHPAFSITLVVNNSVLKFKPSTLQNVQPAFILLVLAVAHSTIASPLPHKGEDGYSSAGPVLPPPAPAPVVPVVSPAPVKEPYSNTSGPVVHSEPTGSVVSPSSKPAPLPHSSKDNYSNPSGPVVPLPQPAGSVVSPTSKPAPHINPSPTVTLHPLAVSRSWWGTPSGTPAPGANIPGGPRGISNGPAGSPIGGRPIQGGGFVGGNPVGGAPVGGPGVIGGGYGGVGGPVGRTSGGVPFGGSGGLGGGLPGVGGGFGGVGGPTGGVGGPVGGVGGPIGGISGGFGGVPLNGLNNGGLVGGPEVQQRGRWIRWRGRRIRKCWWRRRNVLSSQLTPAIRPIPTSSLNSMGMGSLGAGASGIIGGSGAINSVGGGFGSVGGGFGGVGGGFGGVGGGFGGVGGGFGAVNGGFGAVNGGFGAVNEDSVPLTEDLEVLAVESVVLASAESIRPNPNLIFELYGNGSTRSRRAIPRRRHYRRLRRFNSVGGGFGGVGAGFGAANAGFGAVNGGFGGVGGGMGGVGVGGMASQSSSSHQQSDQNQSSSMNSMGMGPLGVGGVSQATSNQAHSQSDSNSSNTGFF
ncbi:hypothetical protein H4Q26_007414 [Puccinia striiformis f. sp. tritici PST-130]|nr:hypothetical protein H4Q26_007414 [Puccinia striiformis f. sp. tritici PST-130]